MRSLLYSGRSNYRDDLLNLTVYALQYPEFWKLQTRAFLTLQILLTNYQDSVFGALSIYIQVHLSKLGQFKGILLP